MATKKDDKKSAAETFSKLMKKFGTTVGYVFDDPKVKEAAKEFASSVVDAAAKVAQDKVKAEQTRAKFRSVGKAAETLGKSLETHFQS